ncbi:MAG: MCP four helix bundle domain-containing protein, partial [Dongiaceae bacterium]
MSLRSKLLFGFLSVVLLATIAGANSIYSVSRLGELAIDMYDKPLMAINFARAAQTDFLRARSALRQTTGQGGEADTDARDEAESAYEDLVDNLDVVAERAYEQRSVELIAETTAALGEWWEKSQAGIESAGTASPAVAEVVAALDEAIAEKLDLLVEYESENGYNFRRDAVAAIDRAWWVTIGFGGAVVILGVLVALALGNRLSRVI